MINITKNEKPLGAVYFYVDRWIAQLDKSISYRSQSFKTKEQAIDALLHFKLNQLPIISFDSLININNKINIIA